MTATVMNDVGDHLYFVPALYHAHLPHAGEDLWPVSE